MSWSHGTKYAYKRKDCRCEVCVEAQRERWLTEYHRNKKLKGKPVKTLVHGTTTGYNYGCRCVDCTEAVNAYQRAAKGGTAPKNAKPKYGTVRSTKEVT